VATYVNKVKNSFYLKNGRMPSCEEVNEILNEKYNFTLPHEDIIRAKYVSIDAPVSEDAYYRNQEYEAKSSVSPLNDIMEREEECERVESLLSKLNDKESEIMRMLYGIGTEEMTINGVSETVGLTGERVRQIRNDAIAKLKAYIVKSK
jgi:RNA polymerase primary sigma factor